MVHQTVIYDAVFYMFFNTAFLWCSFSIPEKKARKRLAIIATKAVRPNFTRAWRTEIVLKMRFQKLRPQGRLMSWNTLLWAEMNNSTKIRHLNGWTQALIFLYSSSSTSTHGVAPYVKWVIFWTDPDSFRSSVPFARCLWFSGYNSKRFISEISNHRFFVHPLISFAIPHVVKDDAIFTTNWSIT